MVPDPAIFVINLQDANNKLFFLSYSVYNFLKVHLHHFSNTKSQKEVKKQYESRFFLLVLLDRRIQETQKHMDPTDPASDLDLQHCSRRDVPDRNDLKRLVPDPKTHFCEKFSRLEVTKFPNIW
jgi:hypothetical protein